MLPMHAAAPAPLPEQCASAVFVSEHCAAWTGSALACFVQAGATCFSRPLSDQQPGKTQRKTWRQKSRKSFPMIENYLIKPQAIDLLPEKFPA